MRKSLVLAAAVFLAAVAAAHTAQGAPKAQLWARWDKSLPGGALTVDHSRWDQFLSKYLSPRPSGISRMRYSSVTSDDRAVLESYLASLEGVPVTGLDRKEQLAFWINLYNAGTVRIVLDHYPVKSIRDIDISPGLFSNGPWGAKEFTVEGEKLSLNDIEHRILRPIWKDPRLHYAVNCASLGCPNLQPAAFTAGNSEELLERGAREYVNHPRGVSLEKDQLTFSSIYKWFEEDFGGSREGVIEHLVQYASPALAEGLRSFKGRMRDRYDWSLNDE